MSPSVTVLMPVYNGLPYLRAAIESVLRPTLSDYEFLIIDDFSNDDSSACIKSYRDPRIRVDRNDRNLGTSGSMNRGFELAPAEYVASIDQDDVCLPKRMERQLAKLEASSD